jgi:hypothetical protein
MKKKIFFMLMYLVKKNKDEGEIENDYNDDEDCENCIRMDDANTHTHTHTHRHGFRLVATDLYCYN